MTAAVAQRGRPREFDTEEVLDRLLEVFWARGFEATSIADVVEATGLNKSSLYNSFGDKAALYAAAIDRYVEVRGSMLTEVLGNGTEGLGDIRRLLDLQETEVAQENGRLGCLVVNTSTELGLRDEVATGQAQRFRQLLRDAVRAAFDRAEARGEIKSGVAASYTEIVVAFTMSLGVLSRGSASNDELHGQFAAMQDLVDSWRIA